MLSTSSSIVIVIEGLIEAKAKITTNTYIHMPSLTILELVRTSTLLDSTTNPLSKEFSKASLASSLQGAIL